MLKTKDIILRDFTESDIEKRIYWETTETEWQLWDGPWEYEGLTAVQKQEELAHYIAYLKGLASRMETISPEEKRFSFQIDTNTLPPRYIGWVTSYCIDDDYNYTESDTGYLTIGIDIPDEHVRGRGYAYQALSLFLDYLLTYGESALYTQTWSGNARMIHIAEKIGFRECCRKKDLRTVRGQKYDGLTFRLDLDAYREFKKTYLGKLILFSHNMEAKTR